MCGYDCPSGAPIFANGAATAAFQAAVQSVATSRQQGGEVSVDYSQLETPEDYQLALEHLDSLQGDPDVNQASLATATFDTAIAGSRAKFLQITNIDVAKGVFEVRYAQSQRAVAGYGAGVAGSGLAINGARAAYGGWRALPPHIRRELGAFALDIAAEIFVSNGKLDTSTSPRVSREAVLPGKLRRTRGLIPR